MNHMDLWVKSMWSHRHSIVMVDNLAMHFHIVAGPKVAAIDNFRLKIRNQNLHFLIERLNYQNFLLKKLNFHILKYKESNF